MKDIRPTLYRITVLALLGLIAVHLQRQSNEQLRSQIDLRLRIEETRERAEFAAVLEGAQRSADLWFELSLNTPEIVALVAEASRVDPAGATFEAIHNRLHEDLADTYRDMVAGGVKQLVFHTPDSTVVLRGHRPERFGDYLGEIRSTVAAVNSEHQIIRGFEEGRTFNGFRNVYPYFLEGTYVGAVEVSYSAAFVVREMDSVYHGTCDFLIDRRVVEQKVHPDEIDNYIESRISPRFMQETNSFTDLMAIEPHMSDRRIALIHETVPASFVAALESFTAGSILHMLEDEPLALLPLAIHNYENEPVAYLLSYEPLPGVLNIMTNHRRESALRNAGLVVIAATVVLVLQMWANTKNRNARLTQLVHERESLVRDTLHRTKNNMNVIKSLLALQMSRIDDPAAEGILRELDDRIDAFVHVQEMLYRSSDLRLIDLAEYFPTIARSTVENATTGTTVSVQFEVESRAVPARLATQLGLIVTELATNSMKYAFPDRATGSIRLRATRLTEGRDDILEIELRDDEIGISEEAQKSDGFGTDLVRSIVTDQLRGEIHLTVDSGTRWFIRVPLTDT